MTFVETYLRFVRSEAINNSIKTETKFELHRISVHLHVLINV